MAEVNGFTDNFRYVAEGVTLKHSYLHVTAEPAFLRLVEALALLKPVAGKVQPFVIAFFSGGKGPSVAGLPAPVPAECEAYFKEQVDPFLSLLVRAVAAAEPADIPAFLLDLLSKHPDLEASVWPKAPEPAPAPPAPESGKPPKPALKGSAGASADAPAPHGHVSFVPPPPTRNGMKLGRCVRGGLLAAEAYWLLVYCAFCCLSDSLSACVVVRVRVVCVVCVRERQEERS